MADLTQTAANVLPSTPVNTAFGIAGAAITAGMPIYKDSADSSKLKPCRANALGTSAADGIALNTAASGQYVTYALPGSFINLGATLVVGQVYLVSAAVAGNIMPVSDLTTGNFPFILGIASSTSLLKMAFSGTGVARA